MSASVSDVCGQATSRTPQPSSLSVAENLLWCDLVQQVGTEIEASVGAGLVALKSLLTEGKADRRTVSILRDALVRAQRVGLASRQIAWLAGQPAMRGPEPLRFDVLLRNAVAQRSSHSKARAVSLTGLMPGIEVLAEKQLTTMLPQAVLDWALEHADSEIEFMLEQIEGQPGMAAFTCRFRHRSAPHGARRFGGTATWGVNWQLTRHLKQALGWSLRTGEAGPMTWMKLEFPCKSPQSAIEVIEIEPTR